MPGAAVLEAPLFRLLENIARFLLAVVQWRSQAHTAARTSPFTTETWPAFFLGGQRCCSCPCSSCSGQQNPNSNVPAAGARLEPPTALSPNASTLHPPQHGGGAL